MYLISNQPLFMVVGKKVKFNSFIDVLSYFPSFSSFFLQHEASMAIMKHRMSMAQAVHNRPIHMSLPELLLKDCSAET